MPDSNSAILVVMKPNATEKLQRPPRCYCTFAECYLNERQHLSNIINTGLHKFKGPSTCDWCRSRIKSSRVPHVIFAFKELKSTASQQINTVSKSEMDNTYW
jgi:hypothetical protein